MYCKQCGQPLTDGSRFCSTCGISAQAEVPRPATLVRPGLITVLAVLNFIAAVGLGVTGLVIAFAGIRRDPFLIAVAVLFIGVAVAHVVCGSGLLRLKPHGRILQLIFAFIGLLGFPLGTLVSILILVYFFSDGVKILFSGKTPDQLTDSEAVILAQQPSMGIVLALIAAVGVIGIVVMGIVSAIAIPNLLNAIDRGKQKRTVADLRSIGTAIEEYSIDNDFYPSAASLEELERHLAPSYIRALPGRDGWNNLIVVQSSPGEYVLLSAGKDGTFDAAEPVGPTGTFTSDIVFSNGQFVQWPEGLQH
jgi:general secretion pathway protein G